MECPYGVQSIAGDPFLPDVTVSDIVETAGAIQQESSRATAPGESSLSLPEVVDPGPPCDVQPASGAGLLRVATTRALEIVASEYTDACRDDLPVGDLAGPSLAVQPSESDAHLTLRAAPFAEERAAFHGADAGPHVEGGDCDPPPTPQAAFTYEGAAATSGCQDSNSSQPRYRRVPQLEVQCRVAATVLPSRRDYERERQAARLEYTIATCQQIVARQRADGLRMAVQLEEKAREAETAMRRGQYIKEELEQAEHDLYGIRKDLFNTTRSRDALRQQARTARYELAEAQQDLAEVEEKSENRRRTLANLQPKNNETKQELIKAEERLETAEEELDVCRVELQEMEELLRWYKHNFGDYSH